MVAYDTHYVILQQRPAQQIATGKAKDNANSQPLGNDW